MERKTLTLLVALALSGCLGGNGTNDETPDQLDHEDEPPQAILDANQTNGQAPLSVTFTLNATDHASSNWSLDPGDGTPPFTGQTLPTTIEHTYPDPDENTPRFAIDAGNQTDQATLTLTVEPPAYEDDEEDQGANDGTTNDGDDAPTNGDDVPDSVTITGSALLGHPFHPAECFNEGVDGDMHEIGPAQPGWAYQLEPTETFAVYWWNGDEYLEAGDDIGTVPASADTIELCMMEGNSEVDYEVTLHDPEHPDAP